MFKLVESKGGILGADELVPFFAGVADEQEMAKTITRILGDVRLLWCRDVAVQLADGVPMLHVGSVVAWLGRRLVVDENLCFGPLEKGHRCIALNKADPSEVPLSDEKNIWRVRYRGRLAPASPGEASDDAVELVRLRADRRRGIELDERWWPPLRRIADDGRSLAALEQLRRQIGVVRQAGSGLGYLLADGERLGWPNVLPTLIDTIERLSDSPLPPEKMGDDAECVSWAIDRLNDLLDFPPELPQMGRTLRLRRRLDAQSNGDPHRVVVRRPSDPKQRGWLAVVFHPAVGNGDLRVRVLPGSGSLRITPGRATLVREWGDAEQIELHVRRDGRLKAASYA